MIGALIRFVDFFRVGVLRRIPLQTFRYLACGGINWALSTMIYWTAFNFLFAKRNLNLEIITISPHIAALGISLPVSFAVGFWMQKNVSFSASPLAGRTQLWRYFLTAAAMLGVTYGLEKLFVETLHIYPTVAFMTIYLITAALGFMAQKHFTFRGA